VSTKIEVNRDEFYSTNLKLVSKLYVYFLHSSWPICHRLPRQTHSFKMADAKAEPKVEAAPPPPPPEPVQAPPPPPTPPAAPEPPEETGAGERRPVDEANADFGERKNSLIYGRESEKLINRPPNFEKDFGICLLLLGFFAIIFIVVSVLLLMFGNKDVYELKRQPN